MSQFNRALGLAPLPPRRFSLLSSKLAVLAPAPPIPLGPRPPTCIPCVPPPNPTNPPPLLSLPSGVALAYSNSLAGRLCDLTARRGMGATGCFLGGAAVTSVSILALLLFSWFGELGKETPAPAAAQAPKKAA